jgi:hypothetical protein
MKRKGSRVDAGHFYRQTRPDGPLMPTAPGLPDVWICRRLADFPGQRAPEGAIVGHCTRCQYPIAFNPARVLMVPSTTPRICMQCANIEPLPL